MNPLALDAFAPPRGWRYIFPWPPSNNRYYRHLTKGRLAGRTLISKNGREYREMVYARVAEQGRPVQPLSGRLRLEVHAYPPDARKRDLSNLTKCLEDSLVRAGVMVDDSQIDQLYLERRPKDAPFGRVEVLVLPLPEPKGACD